MNFNKIILSYIIICRLFIEQWVLNLLIFIPFENRAFHYYICFFFGWEKLAFMKFVLRDIIHVPSVFMHEVNLEGSEFAEHNTLLYFKTDCLLKRRFVLSVPKDTVKCFFKDAFRIHCNVWKREIGYLQINCWKLIFV